MRQLLGALFGFLTLATLWTVVAVTSYNIVGAIGLLLPAALLFFFLNIVLTEGF